LNTIVVNEKVAVLDDIFMHANDWSLDDLPPFPKPRERQQH